MSNATDLATAALDRLVGMLGEDAMFVLAARPRDAKEALDAVSALIEAGFHEED